jgi:hypothetical protein
VGSKVDLAFVKRTLSEMERLEGEGFPRTFLSEEGLLTSDRMSLFKDGAKTTHSDFSNRRRLLLSFGLWLASPKLDRIENGSRRFQAVLFGPFSYLKKSVTRNARQEGGVVPTPAESKPDEWLDIGVALNEVSRDLTLHLSNGNTELSALEKRSAGRIQAYDPGTNSVRFFGHEEEIELLDYYDKPAKLPVSLAMSPPDLEDEALRLELSYIQEILRRVGMGGLPYYLPLDVGLERLLIVIKGLEAFSNYLAHRDGKKGVVNADMMVESIRNTDTRIMDLLV